MRLLGTVCMLLFVTLAFAPTVEAACPGFMVMTGNARSTSGIGVYDARIFRQVGATGLGFRIALYNVAGFLETSAVFLGTDNASCVSLGEEYHADATTAGVTFHLDGFQVNKVIAATGMWSSYELVMRTAV